MERYWPPVYATLRRRGMKQLEAAEATQAFFADVVLQRRLFERAVRERGKLRSLLLTSLKRFLVDQHRRRAARGSGLTLSLDTLDREDRIVERAPDFDSDELFERRWALAALQEAMKRCEAKFVSNGSVKHWRAFEAHVVRPALTCAEPEPLERVAERVGFRTAADCAAAVQVVRLRVLALMREVVAETVDGDDDADAEYDRALQMLM